ncbi:putative meiosis specific protein Hop1 [Aspergillus campestris IBT 28561]|uniref:Meiosis specific protein Hop1 n=1 Tax=Aspergillus campestris (strain IBT 28561) TaxID=1392248 RepID=A0A2I1CT58_ASPC2|nr:putative meiosis specific protein Hop1 [Aspergillus campestris IBT 28561]PKY00797.1 putative meiosis specific protein Hop1 [Aspergillus campestris IBT 28561]
MVRTRPTGPASAVQLQPVKLIQPIVAESKIAPRSKAQTQVAAPPTLTTTHESLALQQQQSLEMVQIMLHVSLGTLFYLRELLPLPCFDDRDLKKAQKTNELSYSEFIHEPPTQDSPEGRPEVPFGAGRRGQPLKIIVRGADPNAEMILNLLENGIFDALRKNVLEAVQLTILVDKDTPENVLESYTFSFKYTGAAGDMNSRLERLSIDPVGCVADMKTAQTARIGLETIIRRLITLSAFLPTLPNKRHLGVHLFYTEDCPSDYEPPGFVGGRNETIKYPFSENWHKESQPCGTMDSGWHTVGLKVTSLKWTGPDPGAFEAPPQVPMDMEYSDTAQRSDDIGFPEDVSRGKESPTNASAKDNSQSSADQQMELESPHEEQSSQEAAQAGQKIVESMSPTRPEIPPESFDSEEATQDKAERIKLQMMLPTQEAPGPDSALIPTQPIQSDILSEKDTPAPVEQNKSRLKQIKVDKIREHARGQIRDRQGNQEQDQASVKCQCGWEGEEKAMVRCSFCHTQQHALCYGFEGPTDPRIPDVHACYQCLLEPNEPQLLREMNNQVLLRRALRIIIDEGFPSTTSAFTQKLHCNGQTVVQITDLLKKQKLLLPTQGYKMKGFVRKGLPKFYIPSSDDVRERIHKEIMDPMVKIGQHYNQNAPDKPVEAPDRANTPKNPSIDNFIPRENEQPVGEEGAQKPQVYTNGSEPPTPEPQTRKRRITPDIPDDTSGTDDLEKTDITPQATQPNHSLPNGPEPGKKPARRSGMSADDRLITSQNIPESSEETGGDSPRRSHRKRRKVSNFSKLIDVGADTSDNDSGFQPGRTAQ